MDPSNSYDPEARAADLGLDPEALEGYEPGEPAVRTTRRERMEALQARYMPDDRESVDIGHRFAAVHRHDQSGGYDVVSCETFAAACAYLGDTVLDGWTPEAVYDLDIAERIAVQVAAPIVTARRTDGETTA